VTDGTPSLAVSSAQSLPRFLQERRSNERVAAVVVFNLKNHLVAAGVSASNAMGSLALALLVMGTPGCQASEQSMELAVQVHVSVKNPDNLKELGDSPTLFLTAKPVNYNVPFASKQEVWALPGPSDGPAMRTYEIRLREDLLVPQEQYEKLMNVLTGADIVVSARLDRDGDPSTREPQDLVGQGVAAWDQSSKRWRAADVKLQGRGIFGKLVTKRTK